MPKQTNFMINTTNHMKIWISFVSYAYTLNDPIQCNKNKPKIRRNEKKKEVEKLKWKQQQLTKKSFENRIEYLFEIKSAFNFLKINNWLENMLPLNSVWMWVCLS